jgi:Fic family protein
MDYKTLTAKLAKIRSLPRLSKAASQNLKEWFKVELTYTSNALEGNTLGRMETALVIEKGITVGGKSIFEHLEARNHAEAIDLVTVWVESKNKLSEKNVLEI